MVGGDKYGGVAVVWRSEPDAQFACEVFDALRARFRCLGHGVFQCLADARRHVVRFQLLLGERPLQFRCLFGATAGEGEIERGAQRVDVGGGGEARYAAVLLQRRVAVGTTDAADGGGGVPLLVIMLGEAEVDDHWTVSSRF